MCCLLGSLEVVDEIPASGVGAMNRRKQMSVRHGLLPGTGIVAKDHADATGLLHHQTLLDSAVHSSGAHNYLAAHLGRVQCAGQAQRPTGKQEISWFRTLHDRHGSASNWWY